MILKELIALNEGKMKEKHIELLDAIENEFGCDQEMCELIAKDLLENGLKSAKDQQRVDDFYYDHFESQMDYGTRKGRSGDPSNWIGDRLGELFGKYL